LLKSLQLELEEDLLLSAARGIAALHGLV
jgi:hypothetical protein